MCHRFIGLTYEQVCAVTDDLNQWVNNRVLGTVRITDPTPDWPVSLGRTDDAPMQVPGRVISAITTTAAGTGLPSPFAPQQMTWGFTAEWKRGFIYNTRLESALADKGMWAGFLENGRCLVPVWSFFEPHATERIRSARTGRPVKRPYRFEDPDAQPLYLGGVFAQDHASIVTVPPNRSVSPVHDRMPLVLTRAEAGQWLSADLSDIQAGASRLLDRNDLALDVQPESDQPPLPAAGDSNQLKLF